MLKVSMYSSEPVYYFPLVVAVVALRWDCYRPHQSFFEFFSKDLQIYIFLTFSAEAEAAH